MMRTRTRLTAIAIGLGLLGGAVAPLSADDDLAPVRTGLESALPQQALERFFAEPPLVFRGAVERGSAVYRERVNGVVLLATATAVATGVVVSTDGDIVTNDHIAREAYRARGEAWVAVWFKPPPGVRADKGNFLLARVAQSDPGHDLARLRLAQTVPASATVVPLAIAVPDVGQDVFTIGHPKTHAWSFTRGVVSQVRPDYRWRYGVGVQRTATAIQTQVPINPGNSGGPLLNDAGAMVGVVVGSATETHGVSFAVAVQHVRELLTR